MQILSSLFLNEHNWQDWWYYTYQYVKQGGDEFLNFLEFRTFHFQIFLSFIFGRNHKDLSPLEYESYFQVYNSD